MPEWELYKQDHPGKWGSVLAIDFETHGLDPWSEEFEPVGLGLTGGEYDSIYIILRGAEPGALANVVRYLHQFKLLAHNVLFDAAVLRWCERRSGVPSAWPWLGCTYALAQQLAGEGWEGQSWGLKSLMKTLLLWPDTNEAELDGWLIGHGYFKVNHAKQNVVSKADMWRAPDEILGKYCKLDTEACWLLWSKILLPVARKHPVSEFYQTGLTMELFRRLLDQQDRGILIDVPQLKAHKESLELAITLKFGQWRLRADVAPHMQTYEDLQFDMLLAKQPKWLTKDGLVSKNWESWRQKVEDLEQVPCHFSYSSPKDLSWLFYGRMGCEVLIETEGEKPATNDKALSAFGPAGQALLAVIDLETELRYVEGCLANVNSEGILRPKFSYGTITGRLKGGLGKD